MERLSGALHAPDRGLHRCDPLEMHYFRNEGETDWQAFFVRVPFDPSDTIVVPWHPGDRLPRDRYHRMQRRALKEPPQPPSRHRSVGPGPPDRLAGHLLEGLEMAVLVGEAHVPLRFELVDAQREQP